MPFLSTEIPHDAGCQQVAEEKGQVSQLVCETCGFVNGKVTCDFSLYLLYYLIFYMLIFTFFGNKCNMQQAFSLGLQVQPDGAAALRRSALNMGLPPQLRLGGIDKLGRHQIDVKSVSKHFGDMVYCVVFLVGRL